MSVEEQEVRTKNLGLLIGKLIRTEDMGICLQVKNGKRSEMMPIAMFAELCNAFAQERVIELHI